MALLHHISLCHFAQSRGHLPQASLSQSWNENRSDLIKVLTTINDKVKRFIVDGTASHLPISVVAYTITPQILLNINLRLADSQLERRRQKRLLSFYTELTRVYHVRYDVTHVDGWIERVLRIFESSALHGNSTTSKSSDKASRSSVRRLCIPDSVSSSTGKSFSEFLELRPTLYLQLLKVMDYSMATGREVLDSPSARMRLCYPQESYVFPDSVMATPSLSRPLSFPGRGENLNMTDPEDTSARDAMATYDTMTSPYNFDTEMARTASRQDFYLREGFTPADDNLNESNLTSVHIDNSLLDPLYLEFLEQSGNARKNRTTRGSSELDNLWLDMTLFGE